MERDTINPLEGYEIRHDWMGFYICTEDEAIHEDAGNPSVGFDGREHYETIEAAERAAWEMIGEDAPEPECGSAFYLNRPVLSERERRLVDLLRDLLDMNPGARGPVDAARALLRELNQPEENDNAS